MQTGQTNTLEVAPLLPDVATSKGNNSESKNLFISLKTQKNINVAPCCPLVETKDISENAKLPILTHGTHTPYINNIGEKRGNKGQHFLESTIPDSSPFVSQTFAIHEYFYGWMCDFLPDWKAKWDKALQNCDWQKIKTVMLAIFQKLPAAEQAILKPGVEQLEPWFEVSKKYSAACYILSNDQRVEKSAGIFARIEKSVMAVSKNDAIEKLRKQGFEVINPEAVWVEVYVDHAA